MSGIALDLKGKRFGKLVGIRRVENIGINAAWEFRCDCGGTLIYRGSQVARPSGRTDCGCVKIARRKAQEEMRQKARKTLAEKRLERDNARRANAVVAMISRGIPEPQAQRRVKNFSRQRVYQLIFEAEGNCQVCRRPRGAMSDVFCDACAAKNQQRKVRA